MPVYGPYPAPMAYIYTAHFRAEVVQNVDCLAGAPQACTVTNDGSGANYTFDATCTIIGNFGSGTGSNNVTQFVCIVVR